MIELDRIMTRIHYRVARRQSARSQKMIYAHFGYLYGEHKMNMTFHEIQLEINRLEAKADRQERNAAQTRKLIESLKGLQAEKPKK